MSVPRIHYCTWAKSPSSPELALLKASAERLGIELRVLPCNSFLQKPVVLSRLVSRLPEDDLLLFTDGYDVIYAQSEEVIRERFAALDARLVFGGEDGCYHHVAAARAHFEATANGDPYPYLNSGLGLGFVGDIRQMLAEILDGGDEVRRELESSPNKVGFFNDQTLFGRYACSHPGRVVVDTRAELFWTMASEKYDVALHAEFRRGEIKNLRSQTRPCAVHVSHRRKFYLAYLHVAYQMGISLTRSTVDVGLAGDLLDANARQTEQVVIDPELERHLEKLRQAPAQRCDKIAILFIGTGRYVEYFGKFYETSRELFLPKTPKVYWVFTDRVDWPELRSPDGDIVAVEIQREVWPMSTLMRFHYFNQVRHQLLEFSHIIYLDADMFVDSVITEGEFFAHTKPLFGVQHPGNYLKRHSPYESTPESRAKPIEGVDTSIYWQGCLWGGKTREVLDLSWVLERRIEDDLSRDVIARWHDESHLNKYFAELRQHVHTHHPGYAYPERMQGQLDVEQKIVHVAKWNKVARSRPEAKEGSGGSSYEVWPVANSVVPVCLEGLRLRWVNGSFALLDADEHEVAKINATAGQVWLLCSGELRVCELIEIMSALYRASPATIRNDIHQVLRSFESSGLMTLRPGDEGAIQFYSFANNNRARQLQELKESAENQGVSIHFLGHGVGRFPTTLKLELLYDRVRDLDDDQIVCAIDGFDVFLCAGMEEIEQKFLAMDCDCVISAERAYAHQYPKYRKHFDGLATKSPYRYINTGSLIGYAHALKKICAPTLTTRLQPKVINPRSINKIKRWSSKLAQWVRYKSFDRNFIYSYVYYTDQQHVGKYVARNKKLRIRLDYDTELFWCTALEWGNLEDHYRIEDGRIVNVHTGNAPSMIHVPGWRAHRRVFEKLYAVQASLVEQQGSGD